MTNHILGKMPNHVRVLVVDDDEDDFILLQEHLSEIQDYTFEAMWASKYSEGLQKIEEFKPDICLFDFLLGAKTGLNLLREVRNTGNDTPIILLTGKGDVSIDREAMALGATDYLVKSELNSETIERSLRYALVHTEALRALRSSGQLYQTIFEKSKNMIFLADIETLDFIEVNHSVLPLLGTERTQFLRQLRFNDIFLDPHVADEIVYTLRRGEKDVTDQEIVLRNAKNEPINCSISAVKHQTAKGETLIHGTISNMTHLRQAEQDRLIAEKLEATSRFTRALAHEVRNPLTNIDLSVEQLESEYPEAEWLDYMEIIKRNSQRIGRLVSELLNTSNPAKLEFSEHHLHTLIIEAVDMAHDRLSLKNISIHLDFTQDNPSVEASAEALKIAFLNLIVNAIEATAEGDGRITISTSIHDNDCIVSIEDNGYGIPADQLTRIFEPYFTSKPKGSGLGLITTLNVVKAHKGTIRVQSTVGKGTRFLITLPILSV